MPYKKIPALDLNVINKRMKELWSANGDGQLTIFQHKTILTAAQIATLPTTYVEAVPAPGVGKILLFHSAAFVAEGKGMVGLNVDGDTIFSVVYGNWDLDASTYTTMLFNPTYVAVAFLPATTGTVLTSGKLSGYSEVYFANKNLIENVPLNIAAYNTTGNFTGFDAGSNLEVTVFYSIVDL